MCDLLRDYAECSPIAVKITGIETMPKDLQNYMDKVLEVFIDVHGEVPQIHFEVIS